MTPLAQGKETELPSIIDELLVIDDEAIVRNSLVSILRKSGYPCTTASSVKEGIKQLKKKEFSLVLSDLRMGDGTGLDIIDHIKKNYPQTLVILLTGFASLDTAMLALRKGAYDYLTKPYKVEVLLHTVERSLEKRRHAMENERLRSELEQAYYMTIKALAAAIDAKDRYTLGHSDRVMQYSLDIAKELNNSPDANLHMDLNLIQYASLIHDIGKIGIRDNILVKPGKLTAKEYSQIRLHPLVGYEILKEVQYMEEVKLIIRHHHEWYDGTGYPDGLKGNEIPIGSTIIAVADAYDAMTSERPYRHRMTHRQAIQELTLYSGKQFSPLIVELFCSIYRNQPHFSSNARHEMYIYPS